MSPVQQAVLFTSLELRGVRAKNRIVLSPMSQYSALDGHVTDWHLVTLGKFAQGGAGITFVEASAVTEEGRVSHGDVGIWKDSHVPGLKRIADFIRSQGSIPAIQLGHAGRKGSRARPWEGNGPLTNDPETTKTGWVTIGPSSVTFGSSWNPPRALDAHSMQLLREAFVAATLRAKEAGFDIVELHGAHGYLLHSFLSPISNHRSDSYGGLLENRMRFPLEIARLVRRVWPEEKPLFFRCSAVDYVDGGWSLDDTVALTRELAAVGVDVMDCSSGGISGAAGGQPRMVTGTLGFQLPLSQHIREHTGLPTMAVGLILSPHQAEAALREGQADLIAIGREALFNPNWAVHAACALMNEKDSYEHWPEQHGWWLSRRESVLRHAGLEPVDVRVTGAGRYLRQSESQQRR